MFKVAYLVHIANVLFLASYLVKDILWVRLATIPAMLALMVYYFFSDLTEPLCWGALFVLVNIYQVYKLFLERKPIELNEEQSRIYNLAFTSLTLKEFDQLLKVSNNESYESGKCILASNQSVDKVIVLTSGNAEIVKDNNPISNLKEGNFIGEINYLTKKPISVCINALDHVSLICWKAETLQKLFDSNPMLRASWQSLISKNLAMKLYQKQSL